MMRPFGSPARRTVAALLAGAALAVPALAFAQPSSTGAQHQTPPIVIRGLDQIVIEIKGQEIARQVVRELEQVARDPRTRQAMDQVRDLVNDTQRENARTEGGSGATFEGQGMVLSAPGTQGFKQDFSKWQELTRQVTLALDQVESTAARKLQEKTSKDRLASGGDERAPAEYQQQVDSYFKALATRKRP